MFTKLSVSLIVTALVLAACASELERARRAKPIGDDFSRALSSGYLRLAENEQASQYHEHVEYLAHRATSSADGLHPSPKILKNKQLELTSARQRLVKSLSTNARITTPETAAEAQIAYDCWALKSSGDEKAGMQAGMQDCKRRFEAAMGLIPGSATIKSVQSMVTPAARPVVKTSTQPVISPEDHLYQRLKPVGKQSASPQIGEPKHKFMIYFDFNSYLITREADDVMSDVVAKLKANEYKLVRIEGHADRAGPRQYNQKLSHLRANAVQAALSSALSRPLESTVKGFGERIPAKTTRDGIREVLNRRTEILLF